MNMEKESLIHAKKILNVAKLIDTQSELLRCYENDPKIESYIYLVMCDDKKIRAVKSMVSKILGKNYANGVVKRSEQERLTHWG